MTADGGRWAYIGSFTSEGGAGLTTARAEPGTGALRAVAHTADVPDPSYLALTPDGRGLCAVVETERGAVAHFSLADPGSPQLTAEPVPVEGASPTHLAVTPERLFTANYGSGSVSALRMRDGLLGAEPEVARHRGGGPVPGRQEAPHAHAVVPAPGGRWLLAVDLGTDAVLVYGPGLAEGPLRAHGELRLAAGSGPRHLAFHPDGESVYVVHELVSRLTHCRWDPDAGSLRVVGETSLRPPDAQGENYPSGLAVHPDGTRLYVANRGDDTVAVVGLTAEGTPRLRASVGCGGHWPRELALDPEGRRLYVANQRSGDVSWFRLEDPEGVPEAAGALSVPAASCVVFGPASGPE